MMENTASRIDRLALTFGAQGFDPYGVSKKHLEMFLGALSLFYKSYFRVRTRGLENVPASGRAMLVGNHSGGYAIDGAMVISACFLELEPPRLVHAMADKFLSRLPLSSVWTARCGQFTGLRENAVRLLKDERMLLVFPEGVAGVSKLYNERNTLVNFGHGFMRLALQTKTPIIPFGFAGGGDAVPTIYNARGLGKLFGVPYLPLTPWGLPLPLPAQCALVFGRALDFQGSGHEDDGEVSANVALVKGAIAQLILDANAVRSESAQ